MCGIAGFCSLKRCYTDRQSFWENVLISMHQKLIHRGGDASGIYRAPHAGLSHQRLSIRDITHGAQPMIRHHNGADYAIAYNGEIYNTDELIPFRCFLCLSLKRNFCFCHLGWCHRTAFTLSRQGRNKTSFLFCKRQRTGFCFRTKSLILFSGSDTFHRQKQLKGTACGWSCTHTRLWDFPRHLRSSARSLHVF